MADSHYFPFGMYGFPSFRVQSTYALGADVTRGGMAASRSRIYTFITGAVALGNMVGPLVAGEMLEAFDYRPTLVTQLIICCTILFMLIFLKETWPKELRPQQKIDLLHKHNTLVVLYDFLVRDTGINKDETEENVTASGSQHGPLSTIPPQCGQEKQHQRAYVGLLAIVFFFYFGDLVGQGVMFVFYAKTAFNMSPKYLG